MKYREECSVCTQKIKGLYGFRLAPVVKLLFLSEKHAQNLLMAEFDDW